MRRKYIILIIVLSIGGILFFQNLYQERKDKEIKQLADKIEKQKTELEKHFIDYFPKELFDSWYKDKKEKASRKGDTRDETDQTTGSRITNNYEKENSSL